MGQEDVSYEEQACPQTIPFHRPKRAEGHLNLNQSALEAGLSSRLPPLCLASWTQGAVFLRKPPCKPEPPSRLGTSSPGTSEGAEAAAAQPLSPFL